MHRVNRLKRIATTMLAIGFLGFLYPDVCMLDDTCRMVYRAEDGTEQYVYMEEGSEMYYQLLSAEPEEIKIKSRLLEWLSSLW